MIGMNERRLQKGAVCTDIKNRLIQNKETSYMAKMKYEVINREGMAKRAHMETVHGSVETPVFMNVAKY